MNRSRWWLPAMLIWWGLAVFGIASGEVRAQEEASDGAQTVQVDNPYGLRAILEQGDVVARGTFAILALKWRYSKPVAGPARVRLEPRLNPLGPEPSRAE